MTALLVNEDANVIVVDWSAYARLSYSDAVKAVPDVGVNIGFFIKLLVDADKVSLDRLHIIGFNLGAHIAGYAGRYLESCVARITGKHLNTSIA